MGPQLRVRRWDVFRIAMLLVTGCPRQSDHSLAVFAWTTSTILSRTTKFHQLHLLSERQRRRIQGYQLTTHLHSKKNIDPDEESSDSDSPPMLDTVGILAQPIVGISLLSVATTGGGLPAGPLGLVGAIEGLSYLVVVLLAFQALLAPSKERTTSQQLSLFTLGLALAVLFLLISTQGCIPNAKPILDYSAYVRVCDPN